MAKYSLISLLLLIQHAHAAVRTRQHAVQNSSFRGSAAAVYSPTLKPTPHPTRRETSSTDYPTAYPTIVPTYDFSSLLSSYFPTSEMPTQDHHTRNNIRTHSWEEPITFTVSRSTTTTIAEDVAEEMPLPSSTIIDYATSTSIKNEMPSGIERPVRYRNRNPERPSPIMSANSPTAATTSKPTDPTVVNTLADDGTSSSQTWMELVTDDFEENYGIFHSSSVEVEYVTYYPFVKDRRGVLRIQQSSSIYSDNIALDNASTTSKSTEIKVVFSYYANSMEIHDRFCLDYSVDDGSSWHLETCWYAVGDFDNGMWYDDASVAFVLSKDRHDVYDNVDSFRIRFRCMADSASDDVLIDKVQVLELVETDLKSST